MSSHPTSCGYAPALGDVYALCRRGECGDCRFVPTSCGYAPALRTRTGLPSNLMDWDRVRSTMDRTYTFELLERVAHGEPGDSKDSLVSALIDLDDPRAVMPLLALAENLTHPDTVREGAVRALTSGIHDVERDTVRRWFSSNDAVLRIGAAQLLRRSESDLAREVLHDLTHPLLAPVLAAMAFGFEEPYWQADKISYLKHLDPAVRSAAACTLLWDEPINAENALIEGTFDESGEVAIECIRTLTYYPTIRVLRRLSEYNVDPESSAFPYVTGARNDVIFEFTRGLDQLRGAPRAAYARWLHPVANLLGVDATYEPDSQVPNDAVTVAVAGHQRRNQGMWTDELHRSLDDPDGAWAPKLQHLQNLDSASIPLLERKCVLAFLSTHSDPNIRMASCRVLEDLDSAETLLELLADPCLAVRKSACYHLHGVRPSAEIAAATIAPVLNGDVAGTYAHEAIRTWARHRETTAPGKITGELLWLVDEDRESVRCEAIEQLAIRDDRASIAKCVALLVPMAPLVTWAGHGTLLRAAKRLGLHPGRLDHLREIDHAWLQMHLADFD